MLTMSARQTAEAIGWLRRDGSPYTDYVYALYRAGRFPPPIDPELPAREWRWSRRIVEQYAAGEFQPSQANVS